MESVLTFYRDNEDMRKQLLQFGVTVPKTKYTFIPPQAAAQDHPQSVKEGQENVPERWMPNDALGTGESALIFFLRLS